MTRAERPPGATDRDESFAAFVRTHSPSLLRTAVLLTGGPHQGEDLLQETLTYLYPRWSSVAAADSPAAYVRRALSNRFVSQRRSPAAREVGFWEPPEQVDRHDPADEVTARTTVWGLLADLPDKQRAALVLRYFHDLPDEEIAACLDCRPATVRSLLSRGTGAMRSSLMAPTSGAENPR